MQFMILAYDATDEGALDRRMGARMAHFSCIDEYKARGHMHIGAALMDDTGKMIGSTLIVEFPDRGALEAWLNIEPYITEGVWDRVTVTECKIGPSFTKN